MKEPEKCISFLPLTQLWTITSDLDSWMLFPGTVEAPCWDVKRSSIDILCLLSELKLPRKWVFHQSELQDRDGLGLTNWNWILTIQNVLLIGERSDLGTGMPSALIRIALSLKQLACTLEALLNSGLLLDKQAEAVSPTSAGEPAAAFSEQERSCYCGECIGNS